MGKRRDRRQQQASSRRVKLDLSTDDVLPPSETPGSLEVLDSALGEEVKAGAKNQEAANDNPLSLLGQYSDDEADDDDDPDTAPLDNIGSEAGKDSSKNQEGQENAAVSLVAAKTSLDGEQTTQSHVVGDDEQESKSLLEPETRMQGVVPEIEWQTILHEDTGEYYYWNVRTGETTWVKPLPLEIGLESPTNRPMDLDTSLVISPGQLQKDILTRDDQGESGGLDSIPTCESGSQGIEDSLLPCVLTKDTGSENTITCLKASTSLQTELDGLKAQIQRISDGDALGGDAAAAIEMREDLEEPKCKVRSDGSVQGNADNGHELKEVQGEEKDSGKTSPKMKDDSEHAKCEAVEDIQRPFERSSQLEKGSKNETESGDMSVPLAPESVQGTDMGNVTFSDVQDASECTKDMFHTTEAQRTIEEKMAPLAERGEALQQRSNILARGSLGGVSRHARMALQTEARVTDWKAFCALGFVPEACLSFIQNELTQLELVLAAEEATELERQKDFQSASAVEASHEVGPARKDADWSLNWGYYQHGSSTLPEMWKQGQPTAILGNGEDVEEGEIQTSYGEVHSTYAGINLKVSNFAGGEDVDMDVDMEVDDEVEAEPAVPGMSSDAPLHEVPVPFSYPYSLPGSLGAGALAPLDTSCEGESAHYFPIGLAGDSWAPPLPPDDEWAPPPPGETEPAPPPPPDEPPPLPPSSPQQVVETFGMPSVPSEVPVHYFVPEYTTESDPLSQSISAPDYQSVLNPSVYIAFVEDVPGVAYSNSPQPTETLSVEQPYVVASGSSPAFNGWTAPALAPTASLFSEASVKSASYVPSVPSTTSTAADSSVGGASLETKKLAKGKIKKRTHAVAAAPMLNKKVSSLVNKWKQAKEELHGGEDDEDDKALYDVEVLEKKRQKEIEEWRRQQIASGDALDNANFQPLGTIDWRERVKRARKVDSKEGKDGDARSEAPSSTIDSQSLEATKSQKPNLSNLSEGLPAGWQAYWDEASAEVYYGNLITQETTWDRPVT